MTKDNKAYTRIKKLLKLAESDNAHEAEQAAMRAQELMIYHEIDALDIDLDEDTQTRVKEPIVQEVVDPGTRRRSIWKGTLASAIGKGFACKMYWMGARTYLVGRSSDVQTVKYLYDYLVQELARLASKEFSEYKAAGGNIHGKTWKNNFFEGAVTSIGSRLERQRSAIFAKVRQEAESIQTDSSNHAATCTALARVSEVARMESEYREVQDYYRDTVFGGRVRGGVSSNSAYNYTARQAGVQAGRSVRLSGGRPLAKGKDRLGA